MATTMHFGPEWMRNKHQPAGRPQTQDSPVATTPSASAFSALASPALPTGSEKRDDLHSFRYSKEEMLRIYRETGGKGGLGSDVEHWEGVVREVGAEPVSLKEMSEAEKKLFSGPLNSELRRRQSTDFLSPLATQNSPSDRPRLNHSNSSTIGSPLRERFPMKRRDSLDQPSPSTMRKLSLSNLPQAAREAALPSPRARAFEGVLGGNDSWTARRRASEGFTKAPTRETGGDTLDGMEIKEEDEVVGPSDQNSSTSQAINSANNPLSSPQVSNLTASLAGVRLNSQHTVNNHVQGANVPIPGPPPGLDLAAVEWSYLDPQGQVQGPFRADTMQKWHDDGYFTPDLLMKRTNIDQEWTPLGHLIQRATTDRLFLAPPRQALPPAMQQSQFNGHVYQDPNSYYQPAPIRTLRSTALDGYTGSPSDSPTSSLGGRYRDSPDPHAFGGRNGAYGNVDMNATLRNNYAIHQEPSPTVVRRPGFADGTIGPITPTRSSSIDNFGYNNGFSAPVQWHQPTAQIYDNRFGAEGLGYGTPLSSASGLAQQLGTPHDFHTAQPSAQGHLFNDIPNTITNNSYQSRIEGLNNPLPNRPHNDAQLGQLSAAIQGQASSNHEQFVSHETSVITDPRVPLPQALGTSQSSPAWGSIQPNSESKTMGAADSTVPTSASTSAVTNPWNKTVSARPLATDVASPAPAAVDESPISESISIPPKAQAPTPPPEPIPTPAPAVKKTRSKAAKDKESIRVATPAPASIAMPPPSISAAPSPVTPAAKPAWVKDEDIKSKASPVVSSLREIQEAEAKKVEARKNAEREREKAARAATAATGTGDDPQPFVASWGLPTSQAGNRTPSIPSKEPPAALGSPATLATPGWGSGPKTPATKKTMKEIQEEEEKRKKAVAKETAAALTARRGYADSTTKAPTPAPQASVWSTVGPSGKAVAGASTSKPTVTPATTATTALPARPNGLPARPPAAVPATTKPAAPAVKADEKPASPSHDFLKWMSESLKGLDASVNVEEIISMLLSFPMDPDASTAEIISDLIYANSTTLDGRRFASEYVAKRKVDAASRKGTSSTGLGSTKPVSIADVVKAQPKAAATSEWGGFKVVNKKKKGGR